MLYDDSTRPRPVGTSADALDALRREWSTTRDPLARARIERDARAVKLCREIGLG